MQGLLAGWGVRIAIIAVIVVGGLVFRDRISGNAGELQVGDCFDEPTSAGIEVKDVQHHPCNEAHTAEVFFVGNHPAAAGTAVLTEDEYVSFLMSTCLPAFNDYTGTDVIAGGLYDFSAFYPVDSDWQSGDREFTCYAVLLNGGQMTASIKGQ